MTEFRLKDIPSQPGKIAVVTGANVGLGYETTKAFVSKGIEVIMACRNLEKAEASREEILKSHPSATIHVMSLDLNSLTSVREFSRAFNEKHEKLDVLVNNAGLMMPMFFKTRDGFESQFGVNYLGHFLLTSLLFSALDKSEEGRVISLSSIAHDWSEIDFKNFMSDKKTYSKRKSYGQSKLACLMFGYELDRQIKARGSNVKSIPVHPGGSLTNLDRHLPAFVAKTIGLLGFASKPEQGAESIVFAALSPDAISGRYYGPTGFKEFKGPVGEVDSNDYSKDEEKSFRLWEESENLLGQTFFN